MLRKICLRKGRAKPHMSKKNSKPPILLRFGEYVVTAFAERVSGPGWANTPITVVIACPNELQKFRLAFLQPDEQSYDLKVVFPYSMQVQRDMLAAIQPLTRGEGKRKRAKPLCAPAKERLLKKVARLIQRKGRPMLIGEIQDVIKFSSARSLSLLMQWNWRFERNKKGEWLLPSRPHSRS